ncbi:MAG: UbiD family decarboxylase [Firmicutes bacterium]|nr:UbiD family decarboxylase [Bacillota bacterium]
MPYRDLGQYMEALDRAGLLHRVAAEVDKDWEISAVSRRVFQRIPSSRRPAILFEQVKGFEIPVLVGALGASRRIYALALETSVEGIGRKWEEGIARAVPPVLVDTGRCKEVILGEQALDVRDLPNPVWTVGEDPAPFMTAPLVCSKDPETGDRNMGTYRVQVKGKNRLGLMVNHSQNMDLHLQAWKERGEPCPVAIIIGAEPTIGLTSVAQFPYGVDEFAVAGGLRGGDPVELVRCETVDLEVPASAEIVVEGYVPTSEQEWEGPFGEYTGYMGAAGDSWYMNVTCITRRARPVYQAFLSQMPPSESSLIKSIGRELPLLKFLRETCGFPVADVHMPEAAGASPVVLISMSKQYPGQVKEVIWAAWSFAREHGKYTIVFDDDIDVRDMGVVQWALAFRVQPARDIEIWDRCLAVGLDPSSAPVGVTQGDPVRNRGSKMGIDATRSHLYPPVALPPRAHLEAVDRDWNRYGLDDLG